MLFIKKRETEERVKIVEEETPGENEVLYPTGYYTCSEMGTVTHVVNAEENDNDIKIWVYSEKLYLFKYSEETEKRPIVIRKGKDVWYASFNNFIYVYDKIIKGIDVFSSVERTLTLFDPEMYRYTIKVTVHDTTGTNLFKHPWFFFADAMERSKIAAPKESARKALNISYEMNVGSRNKPVYFYLFFIAGKYYCQKYSEIDPLLSTELYVKDFRLSKYSEENLTIRFKENNGELVVIGGYYDPKRYKRLMYDIAKRKIPDQKKRREFYKYMRSYKLKTFSIYRKYPELSERKILETKKELKDFYKYDISRKIDRFLDKN